MSPLLCTEWCEEFFIIFMCFCFLLYQIQNVFNKLYNVSSGIGAFLYLIWWFMLGFLENQCEESNRSKSAISSVSMEFFLLSTILYSSLEKTLSLGYFSVIYLNITSRFWHIARALLLCYRLYTQKSWKCFTYGAL